MKTRLRDFRLWVVVITLALIALTAWSLRYFGRYQPFADLKREYTQSADIGLAASDAVVVGRSGGHRRWRASVKTITFSRDRLSVQADGLSRGQLLSDREQPIVEVSASHAVYRMPFGLYGLTTGSLLHLSGGIRASVLRPQGPTFSTENLVWDAAMNRIICPGTLTAILPRMKVTAGSALYDLGPAHPASGGALRLSGGIQAVVNSPRGLVRLTTGGLNWNPQENVAHSFGTVSAFLPGGVGPMTAQDIAVNTQNGNISALHVHGTFRVSGVVQ